MRHENRVESRKFKVKRLAMVLLTFIFSLSTVLAQTMYVKESDGTQTAYALSNIQKISFSSGNLTVTKTDNSSGLYALNDLRYLSFTDYITSVEKPLSDQTQKLNAYPCPARDVLNIDLTGTTCGEGTISILNSEGKTVLSRQVSQAGVFLIDISHLPEGIYLCLYSNAVKIKTVKIIKQ